MSRFPAEPNAVGPHRRHLLRHPRCACLGRSHFIWSSALDSKESIADKHLCIVRHRSACSLLKTEACPIFGVTISQPESVETLNPAARAGDEEARARGTQKSILERKAPPTFPLVIEMRERACWVTHWVEDSVDCLLHGKDPVVQVR